MKKTEVMVILDKEIVYCLNHPDDNLSKDYQKGFTNGLIQAKYLIGELAQITTPKRKKVNDGLLRDT